ncbi:MAG: hypothetical protein AAB436_04315 [Patescibacteria group bacterium]
MRLRRSQPQTRRQRLQSEEPSRPSSSFSYRSRRSDRSRENGRQKQYENTKRQTARLGRYWLQRFGLLALLLAIIVSAFNVLSLSTNARVLPLTTDSSRSFLRSTEDYEAAASKLLGSSLWNHNKVTVNTAQISGAMLKQFPELTDVTVTVPLFSHRPIVYVEPAQPALILVAKNGSFVVDNKGKALLLGSSPASLNQPKLPVINDQGGLTIKLNRQALSAANVDFIQTVLGQLNAKKLAITGMTLPAATSELDVVVAGQPFVAKFNLQSNNARGQAGTLLATLDTLKKQNIVPTKYIDVRVDGRAYYQ